MNRFGDGLITLLMFALGLGCLTLVFNGLVDGVVSGGEGATFPFATKPVKFILIELAWVSLSLILLLGAWRGLTRWAATKSVVALMRAGSVQFSATPPWAPRARSRAC